MSDIIPQDTEELELKTCPMNNHRYCISDECACIGEPIESTITELKREKANGTRLILWTCRADERLQAAVEWCKTQGLEFEAVNENLPDIIEAFGGDTRKVFAHKYWDDRARVMPPKCVGTYAN